VTLLVLDQHRISGVPTNMPRLKSAKQVLA
jgi:hypothetical protein